ncbi:hypothetical protein E2C01_099341 [Portunus trituberculatus]|uniref:Uncharacterized protein n=1 Tax=Portunus trituberculatus TaxID=210409 RepID=A0A5B7K594_PORTR|nr:hypothetical protein [Portunus trituberculatus]
MQWPRGITRVPSREQKQAEKYTLEEPASRNIMSIQLTTV